MPNNAKQNFSAQDFANITRIRSLAFLDNKRLVYLCDKEGIDQIFQFDLDSSTETQLTNVSEPIDQFFVKRDTSEVIYLNTKTKKYVSLNTNKGKAKNLNWDTDAVFHGTFSPNYDLIAYSLSHNNNEGIWVHKINGTDKKRVYATSDICLPVSFSPNNRYLIIYRVYNSENNNRQDLILVNLETLENKTIHSLVEEGGFLPFAEWNSDSSGFYFVTNDKRNFRAVAFYDLSKDKYRYVYENNFEIGRASLSPDKNLIAIIENRDGYTFPIFYNLKNKEVIESLNYPMGVGDPDGIVWSNNGKTAALIYNWFNGTDSVYLWSKMSNKWNRLNIPSTNQQIPKSSLIEPKLKYYKSFDGLEVPVFVWLPKEASVDNPVPVVVNLHGGPTSQSRPTNNALMQYILNNNYAIVAPNIRGSGGYGKEYEALDDGRKRLNAITDLEYLHKFLQSQKELDAGNAALFGISYGGFMVLAGLAFQSKLWKCGIDVAGISDLVRLLENTTPQERPGVYSEYGTLDKDSKFLKSISPYRHAKNIKAPVLIVHGAQDSRVPVEQATTIYAEIARQNPKSKLIIYENEGHGIVKKENKTDLYPQILDFLKQSMN